MGNGLVTDVYSKPTDAHHYLDHRSCHPNHVKKGIPYGQALRLRRICDSDEVFDKRLKDLKGHLVKREFEGKFVDSQFIRAKSKNRDSLLCQDNTVKKNGRVSFVLNFRPALSGVRNIIPSLWPILLASDDIIRIFGAKPMVAFRRPRNFKDDLLHSKLRGGGEFFG